jgi:hypothetical protein
MTELFEWALKHAAHVVGDVERYGFAVTLTRHSRRIDAPSETSDLSRSVRRARDAVVQC